MASVKTDKGSELNDQSFPMTVPAGFEETKVLGIMNL